MKFSVSLSILMSLVGAAATATAAPVFYDLNFTTTTGLAPYGAFL